MPFSWIQSVEILRIKRGDLFSTSYSPPDQQRGQRGGWWQCHYWFLPGAWPGKGSRGSVENADLCVPCWVYLCTLVCTDTSWYSKMPVNVNSTLSSQCQSSGRCNWPWPCQEFTLNLAGAVIGSDRARSLLSKLARPTFPSLIEDCDWFKHPT